MSTILCRKFARKTDSDFIVAAARALYCDWYLSDEKRERAISGAGVELTDVIPATQRWAFRQAREFVKALEAQGLDGQRNYIEVILQRWFETWNGDREATEENAGWYAAMQAMGHGVGLYDAGRLEVKLPHLEAFPTYSAREMQFRGLK